MSDRHIDFMYSNQNSIKEIKIETKETIYLKEKIVLINDLKELTKENNVYNLYIKLLQIDGGDNYLNQLHLQSFIKTQLELINSIEENVDVNLNRVSNFLLNQNCDNLIKILNRIIEDKENIKIKY